MRFGVVLCIAAVFLLSSVSISAQTVRATVSAADAPSSTLPASPDSSIAVNNSPEETPPTHAFWDKENILLFSGIGFFRALDYASTRNMQARGREEILLPDDVVNNSAGFAALEAAGTMTSVGISYIFHRTGHHKLERWISIGHISVTAFGVGRNYALKSHHPPLDPQ
jgi:hypothetical protein